jgi:hypothetical protein
MPDQFPDIPWHPEAFRNIAMSHLERAFWLDQARHATMYEAIHGSTGMTEEVKQQRKAIIGIAEKLLEAARDREMDSACEMWKKFRRGDKS